MLDGGVAGFFVKSSGIGIKHGLTGPMTATAAADQLNIVSLHDLVA
jgi:hypothetical protein